MPTTRFDSFRRSCAVFAAVLVLGFAAAGCGGDDEEAPAPATTTTGVTESVAITTDELISQGDAICAEVNAAIGTIDASTADETTKSSQRADIYDGLAERLGELGSPSDGEPPTDVIAAAQDLADGSTDVTAFQTAASEYGFTDCAEAPEIPSYPTDPGTDTGSSTGTDSGDTYVPPTTEPVPATPAPAPAPSTGGGVAPTVPPDTGGSTGGSSGGSSSGGIGPG